MKRLVNENEQIKELMEDISEQDLTGQAGGYWGPGNFTKWVGCNITSNAQCTVTLTPNCGVLIP